MSSIQSQNSTGPNHAAVTPRYFTLSCPFTWQDIQAFCASHFNQSDSYIPSLIASQLLKKWHGDTSAIPHEVRGYLQQICTKVTRLDLSGCNLNSGLVHQIRLFFPHVRLLEMTGCTLDSMPISFAQKNRIHSYFPHWVAIDEIGTHTVTAIEQYHINMIARACENRALTTREIPFLYGHDSVRKQFLQLCEHSLLLQTYLQIEQAPPYRAMRLPAIVDERSIEELEERQWELPIDDMETEYVEPDEADESIESLSEAMNGLTFRPAFSLPLSLTTDVFVRSLSYLLPSTLRFTDELMRMQFKAVVPLVKTCRSFRLLLRNIESLSFPATIGAVQTATTFATPQLTASAFPSPSSSPFPSHLRNIQNEFPRLFSLYVQGVDLKKYIVTNNSVLWAKRFFPCFPNVRIVHLPNCHLDRRLGVVLQKLRYLTDLDVVVCDGNETACYEGLQDLLHLRSFSNIPAADDTEFKMAVEEQGRYKGAKLSVRPFISRIHTVTIPFRSQGNICRLTQLRTLHMGIAHAITNVQLGQLATTLPHIEEFSITSTTITEVGILYLAPWRSTLRRVGFVGCGNLQDAGLIRVTEQFPHLTALTSVSNGITDRTLNALPRLTQLAHLLIGGFCSQASTAASVTAAGLREIAKCRQLVSLQITDGTALTNVEVIAYAGLQRLEYMRFCNATRVQLDVFRYFARKLPNCEICLDI